MLAVLAEKFRENCDTFVTLRKSVTKCHKKYHATESVPLYCILNNYTHYFPSFTLLHFKKGKIGDINKIIEVRGNEKE